MSYRLEKIQSLSGNKASVYSVVVGDAKSSLFEQFILENKADYVDEVKDIVNRVRSIGQKTGAKDIFFKEREGNLGDGVCALYDRPSKNLRLYCIRYGNQIIVLGGGGPKQVRALQDDPKLKAENYFLRKLSAEITERIREREITFSIDGLEFEGNLAFETHEEQ